MFTNAVSVDSTWESEQVIRGKAGYAVVGQWSPTHGPHVAPPMWLLRGICGDAQEFLRNRALL